jgi:hypothetical protein
VISFFVVAYLHACIPNMERKCGALHNFKPPQIINRAFHDPFQLKKNNTIPEQNEKKEEFKNVLSRQKIEGLLL